MAEDARAAPLLVWSGEHLRELQRKRRVANRLAGNALGLSAREYGLVLAGRCCPPAIHLPRLAALLRVTVDGLFASPSPQLGEMDNDGRVDN